MAVIVTMTGETFKRYQVVEEDEHLFDELSGPFDGSDFDWPIHFGAQAVRPSGIDESYRSLSSRNITRIARR